MDHSKKILDGKFMTTWKGEISANPEAKIIRLLFFPRGFYHSLESLKVHANLPFQDLSSHNQETIKTIHTWLKN